MRAGSGPACLNRIASNRLAVAARATSRVVLVADDALVAARRNDRRSGGAAKPWPQTRVAQRSGQRRTSARRVRAAVGLASRRRRSAGVSGARARSPRTRRRTAASAASAQRQAGREGVPAEARMIVAGRAWSPEIERVAQMEAARSSGPSRAARRWPRARTRSPGDGSASLSRDGDDADDALVPLRPVTGRRCTRSPRRASTRASSRSGERLLLHRRLDVAPLAIQAIELPRRAAAPRAPCPPAGSGCRSTCRRAGPRR